MTIRYTDNIGFKGIVESHFTDVPGAFTFITVLNLIIDTVVDNLENVDKIGGIIFKTRESLTILNRVFLYYS